MGSVWFVFQGVPVHIEEINACERSVQNHFKNCELMKSWFYFVIPDSFQIVQCLLPKARSVLASSKSGNASARVGHHVNRDPFFCRTWAHRTSYTTVNHVQCACRWQNHSWNYRLNSTRFAIFGQGGRNHAASSVWKLPGNWPHHLTIVSNV